MPLAPTRTVIALGALAGCMIAIAAAAAEPEWVALPSDTTTASLTMTHYAPYASVGVPISIIKRLVVSYWQLPGPMIVRCTDVYVKDVMTDSACERLKPEK